MMEPEGRMESVQTPGEAVERRAEGWTESQTRIDQGRGDIFRATTATETHKLGD